jgi:hypothetical protein
MKILAEYRQRARDCERLANRVRSGGGEQRDAMRKIAAACLEMADTREKMLKPGAAEETV